MMLTPCWPKAGPTGGAGLACPAGICSLICPTIFFAISLLCLLYLPVFQFHWGVPAKNIHCHFKLPAVRFDFFNHTAKIEKRPIIDLDGFTDFKVNLWL